MKSELIGQVRGKFLFRSETSELFVTATVASRCGGGFGRRFQACECEFFFSTKNLTNDRLVEQSLRKML